jgi:LmbE family N-acetylglucosaminyl deacetylase
VRRVAAVVTASMLGVLGIAGAAGGATSAQLKPVELDVLFVGAHPDDEAFTIPAFGQWNEFAGLKTGVVTITRGEGGGNAVGPEEGPALGILREAEERRAVGKAAIENIFYFDTVDFYYTVSSPLTEQLWGHEASLEKLVRIVRETRPEVIVTMDPAPTPGNHGHHQFAARLAVEAFEAAADSARFRDQLREPNVDTWAVKRLFLFDAAGSGPPGPDCASTFVKSEPTDNVFGVWMGTVSPRNGGKTWWQLLWEAAHEYVSQGFGSFPTPPNIPAIIPCNTFTQVSSRVPFDPESTATTGIFEGAAVPAPGGLALGTGLSLTSDRFDVVAGEAFHVTAHVSSSGRAIPNAAVSLSVPAGWTASGSGDLPPVNQARPAATTFTVIPAPTAAPGRFRIAATLRTAGGATGQTNLAVRVAPAVSGLVQRLPQVAQFEGWARDVGAPQLGGLVKPVLSIGVGETRSVRVDLHNWSGETQAGTVSLTLPAGFSASPAAQAYSGLAAGADGSVSFQVTNTDPALPTSNQGGVNGDYDSQVVTTSGAGSSTETFGLELVPVTTVPQAAAAPGVDGVESPGEYTGPALDLSRLWEGSPCDSAADCSGSAKLTWQGDDLYVLVSVSDDVLGTVVPPTDCKRHWRTDSVEIALDPRGSSENTSTTFKTGIFPTTLDAAHSNPPCWERDADNHQGGAETAPGMQVASAIASPYAGSTLEVKISLADLPAAVDPQRLGLNVFIYDSDTQDFTGQTRLGWSTWGGVQGDPYRWGHASLAGYRPPPDRSPTPTDPVIPLTAALSVDSPQSILQSSVDNVPLAGGPAARGDLRIVSGPTLGVAGLTLVLRATEAGRAHVFAWTGSASVGDVVVDLEQRRRTTVTVPLDAAGRLALSSGGVALVSFAAAEGGTVSLQAAVQ